MKNRTSSSETTDAETPAPADGAETLPPWTAADLAKACIAPNTRIAYRSALKLFDESGSPETDAGVADYLGRLYEQGKAAPCAQMAVAALRFRARQRGKPSPVGEAAMRALEGYRRMARERGRGMAAAVRWEQADRAAQLAARAGGLRGLRDAAVLAVASDALLRISEVAALEVSDVSLAEQTLRIRHSKTDQEGEGSLQFLGRPTIERVRAWLQASGLTRGALFRAVQWDRLGDGHLSPRTIRKIIADRATAAGADGRISGHSLRVGGAQSLAAAGATLVEMQHAGRWQSPSMPGHYAQGQLARRGAVAKLRYGTEWDSQNPPDT